MNTNEIEMLARAHHRAMRNWRAIGMQNTVHLDPQAQEDLSVRYAIAEAQMRESHAALRAAIESKP